MSIVAPALPPTPTTERPANRSARAGLRLGIVSIAFAGLFGVTGTLAIIFSIIGLVHASKLDKTHGVAAGRGPSVWGLCLGFVSVFMSAVVIAALILSSQPLYNETRVESLILTTSNKNGAQLINVKCPATVNFSEGDSFDCIGTVKSGTTSKIGVNVDNDKGYITWTMLR